MTTSPPPVPLPVPALAIRFLWGVLVFGPRIRESKPFWFYWGQERSDARGQVACLLPYWALLEVWDRWRGRDG
jgi:hypothetical protein